MLSILRPLALLLLAGTALAAPYKPDADTQVLERLPARATDPAMREIRDLRQALAADPRNPEAAVRLARRYYEQAAAEGDPRFVGYAQAALGPWWEQPAPPVPVRVMRAVLRQFSHQFDAARADLEAAVQARPDDGEAWAWIAAIEMVQTHYEAARRACAGLRAEASPLIVTACTAYADSLSGQAAAASQALHAALRGATDASVAERLWALTRVAEIDERRGDDAAAEAAFREALALGLTDGYLLAAWSDYLLDHGRAREVLALLKDRERSDLLLLRIAIAAKAAGDPAAPRWQADLAARFDAARLRGDATHQKEESRFALVLQGDAPRALALARENYTVQREPADARVLLEAAIAAKDPAAAKPVLDWMAASGVESVLLQRLATRLKGGGS